jgi:1,2-dihydroxy-3-keto-5-methylthiopentene dioxygenase
MGEHPCFKCIRLFTTEQGWQAEFTGSEIAKAFPSFDQYLAALS